MMAPFEFSEMAGLGLAVVFGMFFGLSLERAGLGDPHKLTGVFYFQVFTVPKVMFTAILVAGTGLYLLADLRLLDLSRVYFVPTHVWPQLAGGALFGAGFVVSGYCPGTAVAGLASGKLDALVTLIGVGAGSFLFAVLFPSLEGFYVSSDRGTETLQTFFGVNRWIVLIVLAGLAGGMFMFFGWYEKRAGQS